MLKYVAYLVAYYLYRDPIVITRETEEVVTELVPITIRAQLGILFNTWLGWLVSFLPWLRHYQLQLSVQDGWRYDSPDSRSDIEGFIKDYGVRLDELEKPVEEYATLNEFFSRRLRPGARPIYNPQYDKCAVQPADARVVVFQDLEEAQRLWIKGRRFTLRELLGEQPAGEWQSVVVARLAPDDYHRFHSPVAGTLASVARLGRNLFSVKACAVQSRVNVLCENKRAVLRLETAAFGTVWVAAVGAAQVGSVRLSVERGQVITKGQELGWFQFGGSTVVLVFDATRIRFDGDLVCNSRGGRETLVRQGTSLGQAMR